MKDGGGGGGEMVLCVFVVGWSKVKCAHEDQAVWVAWVGGGEKSQTKEKQPSCSISRGEQVPAFLEQELSPSLCVCVCVSVCV